jgi:hypothetical protein
VNRHGTSNPRLREMTDRPFLRTNQQAAAKKKQLIGSNYVAPVISF